MMRAAFAGAWAVAAALAVACQPETPTEEPADPGATPGENGAGTSSGGAAKSIRLHSGAGHTANIDRVAVAPDGSCAVSRDQIGGTRLWPRLDGSAEPVVVPVLGPQAMSVARAGDAFIVAAVDASLGGHILRLDADGNSESLAELPPFEALFSLTVLPGGKRVLALHRDHTIRLIDLHGKELAKLAERRFRAQEIVLGRKGGAFAAVVKDNPRQAEVQRFAIANKDGKWSIERKGSPTLIAGGTEALLPATAAMSPDARHFAWVDHPEGNEWVVKIATLGSDDAPKEVKVPLATHVVLSLGFAGPRGLLVSANDGSLSWLIDVASGEVRPRTSAPQDFVHQGRAQAVAGGVQVAGHGMWLFVHDIEARQHRYLGYRSFQTQSVTISPSGSHAAFAFAGGPVVIEPLAESSDTGVRLDDANDFGVVTARFLDDDHLLTVDGAGGLRVHAWRTGAVVSERGVGGSVRAVHFEPTRRLVLVERHTGDSRVFELDGDDLVGPYIVADQGFRAGLVSGGLDGDADVVMWSLDSGNKLRTFSLEGLRSDPSRAEVMDMGTPLPSTAVAPLAIDRHGARYGVRWTGSHMELFVQRGDDTVATPAPGGDINGIVPSGDGKRFLAVHQRGQSTSISVHSSETAEEQWSYATGVFHNDVAWSADGTKVGIAAATGAVVLDAVSGEPVRKRCGLEFEAAGTPPGNAFNGLSTKSICEG